MEQKYSSDMEQVHRYLCDDLDAGNSLYSDAIPIVEKYVYKHGYDRFTPEELDDIIAETLKRSIERLHQFAGNSAFTTWVIAIAKKVMLEQLRKRNQYALVDDMEKVIDVDFTIDSELWLQDPLRIVLQQETVNEIDEALAALSPEYRDLILLRFYRKAPAKDVADMFGESVAAINSRYMRAIKAWRKNLKIKLGNSDDFAPQESLT